MCKSLNAKILSGLAFGYCSDTVPKKASKDKKKRYRDFVGFLIANVATGGTVTCVETRL